MSYLHKVTKIGNALGVCLPRRFTEYYRIERGHFCIAKSTIEGALVLHFFDPDKRPDLLEQADATIDYDEEK